MYLQKYLKILDLWIYQPLLMILKDVKITLASVWQPLLLSLNTFMMYNCKPTSMQSVNIMKNGIYKNDKIHLWQPHIELRNMNLR